MEYILSIVWNFKNDCGCIVFKVITINMSSIHNKYKYYKLILYRCYKLKECDRVKL